MVTLFLQAAIIPSIIAIFFVLWWFVFGKREEKRILRELALTFAAFGLAVQTFRSIYFFNHGMYPPDVGWPMWITKDIALLLFISFVCQLMLERRDAERTKKPRRKG